MIEEGQMNMSVCTECNGTGKVTLLNTEITCPKCGGGGASVSCVSSSTGFLQGITAPKYITAYYEPVPDITAYELSRLLPYLLGSLLTESDWERLGPTVTRHFRRTDNVVPIR